MIASVCVDIKAHEVDQTYDYLVPTRYNNMIDVGMRVIVPFGRRTIMGYVLSLKESSEYNQLKSIVKPLDVTPALTKEMIALALALSKQNISPLVSMIQAMLPSALKSKYQKYLVTDDVDALDAKLQPLFKNSQSIPISEALNPYHEVIKHAIKNNALYEVTKVEQVHKKRMVDQLTIIDQNSSVKGAKQQAVVTYLKEHNQALKKDVMKATGASYSTIKSLVSKDIIKQCKIEVYRAIETLYDPLDKDITLNPEQEQVYQTIEANLHHHDVYLIHGVTGSGKTEIYLNLIETVLNKGLEAILLVPEISLTPMMISRFRGRFNDDVAVLHSHLSRGERYDEWRKIRRGEVHVVVGARSAVFAPFEKIGIIIIDEEHSETYKQNQAPSYHALDVARTRAKSYNVPLVLGSATPSVESYYQALNNETHLLELKERANDTSLPDVYVEDMTEEFKNGNRSIFSKRLQSLIEDRLKKGEQIILLLNRRGHSTFVMCRSCGEVIMCPNCDISLTYHEKNNHLKCHYCGHETQNPTVCPSCESPHIRYMGMGTEKVEALLKETFKDARIIRMDRDTTSTKNAHEKLLFQFEHDGDILIGTQMIAKGLDFPNVTLVGVLAADMSLHLPDYKAIEQTFQLLTQVSGRAGRHTIPGEVVIQTYNQDHYAITCAKNQDYDAFYKEEIAIRSLAGYSPIKKLVQIIVSDKEVKKVLKLGTKIVLKIRKEADNNPQVLGPVLPKVARINNYYRAQIIVKYDQDGNIHSVLQDVYKAFHKELAVAIDNHPNLL
jgi:primosomal protein N' (replication factor Y)